MRRTEKGDTVKVAYIGSLNDGTVFDRSSEDKDLEFTVGAGQVIPGFDTAVTGMGIGEKKTVELKTTEAYGYRNENAVVEVSRERLPADIEPVVGQRLKVKEGENKPILVTITEVKSETVVLDANHPLAGEDLTFEITLKEIVNEGSRP